MLVRTSLSKGILAPSTDPAPLPSKVLEGIRQTDRGDVSVPGKVHQTMAQLPSYVHLATTAKVCQTPRLWASYIWLQLWMQWCAHC